MIQGNLDEHNNLTLLLITYIFGGWRSLSLTKATVPNPNANPDANPNHNPDPNLNPNTGPNPNSNSCP